MAAEEPPAAGEPAASPEQQPPPQYDASPIAQQEEYEVPLGAGGPPTAEVDPGARYDPNAPIPSDCQGTYEDPCSSDSLADGAEPVRDPKTVSVETRGSRPGAKEVETTTQEVREVPKEAAEEGEPRSAGRPSANRLSAVPISATGGSLVLALGVGALLYRRLGR